MKRILTVLAALALLAGCAGGEEEAGSRTGMTQQIVEESLVPAEQAPPAPPPAAGDGGAQGRDQLYALKAKKEALDIEKDLLEAQYRVGKLESGEFGAEKAEVEAELEALEAELDRIEASLPRPAAPGLGDMGAAELRERLRELEAAEDALELREDRLAEDYRSGAVTREAFLEGQAGIEAEDDRIDEEKDAVEDRLELLGFDDD